jgi:hypothetical protein
MFVEGLLTFQVTDPLLLMQKIKVSDLTEAMENVGKAELSSVFSTLHIEDISSERNEEKDKSDAVAEGERSLMQPEGKRREGEPRSFICKHVVDHIAPIVAGWGVKIILFQLESIKMADANYSREYEQASLSTAKAKANLRAQVRPAHRTPLGSYALLMLRSRSRSTSL